MIWWIHYQCWSLCLYMPVDISCALLWSWIRWPLVVVLGIPCRQIGSCRGLCLVMSVGTAFCVFEIGSWSWIPVCRNLWGISTNNCLCSGGSPRVCPQKYFWGAGATVLFVESCWYFACGCPLSCEKVRWGWAKSCRIRFSVVNHNTWI